MQTDWKTILDLLGPIAICFGVIALLTWAILQNFKHSRKERELKERPQWDEQSFSKMFYSKNHGRGNIAIRLRRLLSTHLDLPLDGIRPEDPLRDMNAELLARPTLFWSLEEEFQIQINIEDKNQQEIIERLNTFSDLVEYVERKMAEKTPEEISAPKKDDALPAVYYLALRCIPIFCLVGFMMITASSFTSRQWLMRYGTCLFLSGIAIWAIANGGAILWRIIKDFREKGFQAIKDAPLPYVALSGQTTFFFWLGFVMIKMIIRALTDGK